MKTMSDDDQKVLRQINLDIGRYEEEGDWKALRGCLAIQELRTGGEAPVLAFRRVSGACVDARAFLDAVSKGEERTTKITDDDITPEGNHIAIVRCIVEMGGKKYDNLRVFVRADHKALPTVVPFDKCRGFGSALALPASQSGEPERYRLSFSTWASVSCAVGFSLAGRACGFAEPRWHRTGPRPNHALQPTPWIALAFPSLRGRRG